MSLFEKRLQESLKDPFHCAAYFKADAEVAFLGLHHTQLEEEIYAHEGPPPALLHLDGKAGKWVSGRWVPGRPAKVFEIPASVSLTCSCGYPMAFTRKGEGGKSANIFKMKRWRFRCVACGFSKLIARPTRVA